MERTMEVGGRRLWERRTERVAEPSLPVGWVSASFIVNIELVLDVFYRYRCCCCIM